MACTIDQNVLNQFYGSEKFYRHWMMKNLVYTEGMQYIASNGGAWLLDLIVSHQMNKKLQTGMLRDVQFWELKINKETNTAVAICRADSDQPIAVKQEIEYTDFPFDIQINVERTSLDGVNEVMCMMLPSER